MEKSLTESSECQSLDWKIHKRVCDRFGDKRPSDNHRRALYFPGGDEAPKFVWVQVWMQGDGLLSARYEVFDGTPFGVCQEERMPSCRNNIQARNMNRDEHDCIYFHTAEDTSELEPNIAAKSFTRAGVAGTWVKGPLLIMRYTEIGGVGHYPDIEMRDVRHTADYLSFAYRADGLSNRRYLGVVVNSDRDREASYLGSRYYSRPCDGDENIFSRQGCSIANLLGIPLLFTKVAGPGVVDSNQITGRNRGIEYLKRDLNAVKIGSPYSAEQQEMMDRADARYGRAWRNAAGGEVEKSLRGFGSSPEDWSGEHCGTVFVVRADGVPLIMEHMEALCEYAVQIVEPMLQQAITDLPSGSIVTSRELILDGITQKSFLEFFGRYKLSKGGGWRLVPSPYHMTGRMLHMAQRLADDLYDRRRRNME